MPAVSLARPSPGLAAATHDPRVVAVAAHACAREVDADWARLETIAARSIYQTRAFVLPWAATMAPALGVAPLYVVARDAAGRAVALLPLGVSRAGPARVAQLLGGRDAGLRTLLLDPSLDWDRDTLAALLRDVARAARVQALLLFDQPRTLGGIANPVARFPHAASPSDAHETRLSTDAEAMLSARLSKDARGKLRRKAARLAPLGTVRHTMAATAQEREAVIAAFLAQKVKRLRARGIRSEFETPAMRAYLSAAAACEPTSLELHALHVGERIVAVYGGAGFGGRWSGMINSFDEDPEIARWSPGDLLLVRLVTDCCRRGFAWFDLGIGEASYKATICDEPVELVDVVLGWGPLGRAIAASIRLRRSLKTRIKRDPRLFALAQTLRAMRAR